MDEIKLTARICPVCGAVIGLKGEGENEGLSFDNAEQHGSWHSDLNMAIIEAALGIAGGSERI